MSILLNYVKEQSAMSLRDMLKTIDPNNPLVQSESSTSMMQNVFERFKNYTRFLSFYQDFEKNAQEEPIPEEQLLVPDVYYGSIRSWLCSTTNTDRAEDDAELIKNCFDIVAKKLRKTGKGKRLFDEAAQIRLLNDKTIKRLKKKISSMSDGNKKDVIKDINKEFIGKEKDIAIAGGAAGATLIAGETAGFALFTTATSVLHAIGSVMGITFSFSTYTTLTTILGAVFGPVGAIGLFVIIGGAGLRNALNKRKRILAKLFFYLCLMYKIENNYEKSDENAKSVKKLVAPTQEILSDIEKETWLTEISSKSLRGILSELSWQQEFEDIENKKRVVTSLLDRLSELSEKFDELASTIYYSVLIHSDKYSHVWNDFFELRDEVTSSLTELGYKHRILGKSSGSEPLDIGSPIQLPPGNDDFEEGNYLSSDKWHALGFIKESEQMQEILYGDIAASLQNDRNIYIWGPQGHFKRDIAKAIHDFSYQNGGKFIPINYGTLNRDNFEEKFIGNGSGGYLTQSKGGTLLHSGLEQASSFIQSEIMNIYMNQGYTNSKGKHVNLECRTIVISKYPKDQVGDNLKTCFQYMNTYEFNIPGLRDRPGDINKHALYYLLTEAHKQNKTIVDISVIELESKLTSIFMNKSLYDLESTMENFIYQADELTIEKLVHYLKRKRLLPSHQEEESRNDKKIIKSIELIRLFPEGRLHRNKLVINYREEKLSHTTILSNQYFYLVYLLCLERLDDPESRWLSKDKGIADVHINKLKKIAQNRATIDYSWIKKQQQLSTVVSNINKKAKYRFILQEDYITLIPELRDASSIILK